MRIDDSNVIYLDHNATTPLAPEVVEAMMPYLRGEFGNPSSDHVLGRRTRQALVEARASVASLIGAEPGEIVFTSGGTEANNLAIRGTAGATPSTRDRIVTSTVEHPATSAPLALLGASGWRLTQVPVVASGVLDLDAGLDALGDDVALVTVMLAQNETGAVMPVTALASAARAHGAIVHTDAAQAVGKIPVSVDDLGVDLLSIAGHKCYGPKGIGALYVRRGTPLSPLVVGAGQEGGLRPGTENVAGIVGLGVAARLAIDYLVSEPARVGRLRDELWAALSSRIEGMVRYTPDDDCLPNTLLVSFPGAIGAEVLARIPKLAASTGSACHAGEHMPNATLLAVGVAPEVALGAVRLSLGRGTTSGDIDESGELLIGSYETLVAATPSRSVSPKSKGAPR
jgi:cysteine desulfurase